MNQRLKRGPGVLLALCVLGIVSACGGDSSADAPTPTLNPPREATVVMNGDLLWHNTLVFGAREDAARDGSSDFDFTPLLAGVRPIVEGADLAICHNEVTVAPPGPATPTG